MSDTVRVLTLDEHFQHLHSAQKVAQQRQFARWKKKRFGRVTLLVTRPVQDVVFCTVMGVSGIITVPIRGAKQNGLVGLAKGTAVG